MTSPSRSRWAIANWKQNLLRGPAVTLAEAIATGTRFDRRGARVVVAPSFVSLGDVARALDGRLEVFAQDVAAQEAGAFTGEVGPAMLRDAGAHGALVGHSERRHVLGETDAITAAKLATALAGGLVGVLCVGESLAQRETGAECAVVTAQLTAALEPLAATARAAAVESLVIAYEPVWAIGTGRVASAADAQAMHAHIRAVLGALLGPAGAGRSVLYGGSVKPDNAAEILAQPDVDGVLVGGASLDANSFVAIARCVADAH